MDEEIIMKAARMQQHAEELEHQLNLVNEQIKELEQFNEHLLSIGNLNNEEIMASLGKGVYLKADTKEKNMYVNVGAGIIVKKKADEVREIIDTQIKKFYEAKLHIQAQLESYLNELQNIIEEIERNKSKV